MEDHWIGDGFRQNVVKEQEPMINDPWRTLFGLIIEKPFQGLETLERWWHYQCSLFELKSPFKGTVYIIAPGFNPGNKAQPT